MPVQLKVLARGGALVLDAEMRQMMGRRRYIGRTECVSHDAAALPKGEPRHIASPLFLAPDEKPMPHSAYPKSGVPENVPSNTDASDFPILLGYYVRAIREGELWPADEDTAIRCGVKFDPTFGGEYPAKEQ